MQMTGYNNDNVPKSNTFVVKFTEFRDKYRVQLSVTLAVAASITFILAELFHLYKNLFLTVDYYNI